jgi:hypothetical protein
MAGNKKIKKISLAVQVFNLKKVFPKSRYLMRRNCLTWEADLTPSHLSKTYTVQLIYKLNKSPDIHVTKPKLIIPDGKILPHTYSGDRLCLYYPGIGEWRGDLLLAKSIVPWISEWLINYEIWLATGKWCGGGIHPSMNSKITDSNKE